MVRNANALKGPEALANRTRSLRAATVGETVHILNRVLTDVYSSLMGWGT